MASSLRWSIAAVAAIGMFTSCSEESTAPPTPVASVVLSGAPAEGVVMVGATAQLAAQPRDASGGSLARAVEWSSSNNALATVSGAGLVTGVAAGPVTITATSGGIAGTSTLSIRAGIVVPPASAGTPTTTTVLDGAVTLVIPPAATGTTTTLTVAPAAVLPTDNRVLSGATFDFGPTGTVFATPITLSLRFNQAVVPSAKREDLRIYLVEGATLTLLDGGSVDLANNLVSAPVNHFSTYTVVVPADPATAAVSAGNSQSALFGALVATAPAILVRDAQSRPIAFADVTFAVTGGGGSIVGSASVETNADGVAAVQGWQLGPTPGANTLTATVDGAAAVPVVQFTATATAPAAALGVSTAPTSGTSGIPFSVQPVVEVRNQFGSVVPGSTVAVTAALSAGSGTLTGTTTVNAVNGVATFTNLRVDGAGTHSIRFTSGALTAATASGVTITQVVASMAITTQPAGAVSEVAFTTQPAIELRDNAGLRVVGGGGTVTASRASGTGALYAPSLGATFTDGIATFSGLAIEGTGNHTLSFASSGLTSVTSASLAVTSGAAGIKVRLTGSPGGTSATSAQVTIPVLLDLSNRGDTDLASITVTVTWDTTRFGYVANTAGTWQDSQGGTATVIVNDAGAAGGTFAITGFTNDATTASFTLRTITLQTKVTAPVGTTTVSAAVSAAGNAAGSAITIGTRGVTITVTP